MDQLTLPLSARKNGKGNDHHRPGHRQFNNPLRGLINDLRAAEALRAEELGDLRELRASVYREANAQGISARVLRAVLSLQKMGATR